jgi:hypothetical protein
MTFSVPSILTGFRQQPQLGDLVQDQRKQAPRNRHFGHLKSDIFRVPYDFGPYLDHFFRKVVSIRTSSLKNGPLNM